MTDELGEMTEETLLVRDKFFKYTDRRSLYTQIKGLVMKGQEVVAESLEKRRERLRIMLDAEEKSYEEEFSERVRNRYNEGIKKRQIALLEIQDKQKEEKAKFLRSKYIQRQMTVCQEVKDHLHDELTQNAKECQLQQILEKERAIRRERELEKYWQRVSDIKARKEIAEDRELETQRRKCVEHNRQMLLCQMEDKRQRLLVQEQEKIEDGKRMDALRHQLELEEIERRLKKRSPEQQKRGQDQRDEIERRARKRCEERERLAEDHRRLIAKIQKELVTDNEAALRAKEEMRRQSLEFIAYMKRLRKLEEDMLEITYKCADEVRHIDECGVRDIRSSRAYKNQQKAEHNAALKQQRIDECKKREREEAEYEDRHIRENRFAREEITDPVKIAAAQQKYRNELDQQILDIKRYYKELQEEYERSMLPPVDDPEDCKKNFDLVHECMEHHPNWIPYTCGKDRSAQIKSKTKQIKWEDVPPEGILPPEEEKAICSCDNVCFKDKTC